MSAPIPDLARHPAALRVRKLPVPVAVRWMAASGVCHTLEGPVAYAAGDALLTGVQGEQWPVAREKFLATYEPVAPTAAGMDGQYRKRPADVFALRLDQPLELDVPAAGKHLHGNPGDWLLQYAPGDYGIVAASIFDRTYQIVPA
ncbi:PGDYG domain-containing protein [Herbaspirillum sp.]|uniref:PGDYG domain-containing protein n=1 Tax=Herbaspirillum sp. TaxID=1890675 RepID=UPI0025C5D071|nr:PGDYG domain-containing protein [Herbaspirillum sp.]